jgi:hypothetical protein
MDRRALFFLVAAAIGFALTPVADPQHRWVPVVMGITYVVLAVLSALDSWSRNRHVDDR